MLKLYKSVSQCRHFKQIKSVDLLLYLSLMNINQTTVWKIVLQVSNQAVQPLRSLRCICSEYFTDDTVAFTKLTLEMLGAPETTKSSIYHDGHSSTKGFAFFHASKLTKPRARYTVVVIVFSIQSIFKS